MLLCMPLLLLLLLLLLLRLEGCESTHKGAQRKYYNSRVTEMSSNPKFSSRSAVSLLQVQSSGSAVDPQDFFIKVFE